MKLAFFSWGDEPIVVERISSVIGGLELTANDNDFGKSVDGAVIARLRPR